MHARERSFRLGLRSHAAAERFTAGNQREVRQQAQRRGQGSVDRCMGQLRRIRSPAAALHVGKLVTQSCQAPQSESACHICHEGMMHSRSGAVRQHVAGSCVWWCLEQAGNANGVVDFNANRVGRFSHELIPYALCPSRFGCRDQLQCSGRRKFSGRENFFFENGRYHGQSSEESSAGSDIGRWPLAGIPIVPIHF